MGDYVWAWDENTRDVALKQVVETYVNETDELVHVFVNGEEIVATPKHPFYSPVKGWTDAAKLRAGDILVLVNNVDQRGVIFFDNSKHAHGMVGDYNISIALANEMYCAATNQVGGALSGRTTEGIARELRMHYRVSAILPIKKVTVADIGGMEKSRSDYDYNAKMFENLWKTPTVIWEMLF